MRSLHYLNGGTLSPFPAEPEHIELTIGFDEEHPVGCRRARVESSAPRSGDDSVRLLSSAALMVVVPAAWLPENWPAIRATGMWTSCRDGIQIGTSDALP